MIGQDEPAGHEEYSHFPLSAFVPSRPDWPAPSSHPDL